MPVYYASLITPYNDSFDSDLATALNKPEKKAIISLTAGHELIAPEILYFEIGNALSAKKTSKSPFDLPGIKTKATTKDILEAVRESRSK